ncbi:hypothetical protein [Thermococcus prieurii]
MVYYVHTRTGKKQKKKEGFLKSRSVEIVATDLLRHRHTLSGEAGKIHDFIVYRYGRTPAPKKPDAYNSREGIINAITHTRLLCVQRQRPPHSQIL